MHVDEEGGQAARTRYRVIERAGNRAAFVELQPFTGRTHQLRVHMAAIGHPIVGDGKYGGQGKSEEGRVGEEGRTRWVPYHFKKKKSHCTTTAMSVTTTA